MKEKTFKWLKVLQILQLLDILTDTLRVSVEVLVFGILFKITPCLLWVMRNGCFAFVPSWSISSSPAMLCDGGKALNDLVCCSICITTIIIHMYLISTVISLSAWQPFFHLPGFSCSACQTSYATSTPHCGKISSIGRKNNKKRLRL